MLNDETSRNNLFTRRAFLLTSGKTTLMGILLGRMYYMQAICSNEYQTLSEKNSVSLITLLPPRGNITDRNGVLIAINNENFRIILDRRSNDDYRKSLDLLFNLLPLTIINRQKIEQKISKTNSRTPIVIFERATWQDIAIIEENLPYISGIYIELNKLRFYPYNYATSHLIGYVGSISEQEKKAKFHQNMVEFDIGKIGLEKAYDDELRGIFGFKRMEVNAHGSYIRELAITKALPGQDIKVTIDVELQNNIYEKFSQHVGAVVALDIANGNILNLISTPGYDSNKFIGGVPFDYWQDLAQDGYKPLLNRAVNNTYPPGSVFKLIVLLAALESGVSANYQVYCHGSLIIGTRKFRCWYKPGHGTVDMIGAIKHSCNCYLYTVGRLIGADAILNMAARFGFGEKTGIDLIGELSGFIPTRKWKKAKLRYGWQLGDTINTSIGQGYTLTTPLQLACMAAAIASGGNIYRPNLLLGKPAELVRQVNIAPEHLAVIQQGMFQASNTPGGTGYMSRVFDEDYKIAVKTGTSQVMSKRDDSHDLSAKSTSWLHKNHALCIGYGPFKAPRFAVATIVDHGGSGSSTGAPIVRDVLHGLMKKYC